MTNPKLDTDELFEGERELPDDYPVHYDYIYVVDGKLRRSDVKGTVADLKRDLKANKVCSCNASARLDKVLNRKGNK